MTRTQPEARIVNAILKALNGLPHTFAKKTHGSRYSVGWPDIMGVHRGTAFALEVKTATGKATPRQIRELAKWQLAGARVGVVRSVDDALAIVTDGEAGERGAWMDAAHDKAAAAGFDLQIASPLPPTPRSIHDRNPMVEYDPNVIAGPLPRYMRAVATSDASGQIIGMHAEAKADWDQPWERVVE